MSFLRRILLLLVVALAGCDVSPIPEPPNLMPPDPDKLDVRTCLGCDGTVELRGLPGAAAPGALLHVVNLDRGEFDPQTTVVEADGSFFARVSGFENEQRRLQLRLGGDRSPPIDVVGPGLTRLVPHPLGDCLIVEPAAELDLGDGPGGSVVLVRNRCGAPVDFIVQLLRPSDAFTIGSAPPRLQPGERAEITVDFAPPAPGQHEEILFIEATAPEADRRPITLTGRGE